MSNDVTLLYLEYRAVIDRWAQHADHPLLKAAARVLRQEARKLLGEASD